MGGLFAAVGMGTSILISLHPEGLAAPLWIAFGPGERACTTNVPFLNGATSCRVAFGFSTLVMLPLLEVARRQLWRIIKSQEDTIEDLDDSSHTTKG
jgi:hypothetical protein